MLKILDLIKQKDNLTFLEEYEYSDYGQIYCQIREINDLSEHYFKVLSDKSKNFLIIESKLHDLIFPMLDCDSKQALKLVLKQLKCNYSYFESSPEHYWVFPDVETKSFIGAIEFIQKIIGVDKEYEKFTINRRSFHIRGELRPDRFVPKLIENNCCNKVKTFVELLNEHFNDKKLLELADLRYGDKK